MTTFLYLTTISILIISSFSFKVNYPGFLNFLFNNPTFRCNCSKLIIMIDKEKFCRECGIPNREGRILGGEHLTGHEFPWLVSIPIYNRFSAGGILINDQYVLTSATQMTGLTPYDMKVTLGQYDSCYSDLSSINMSVASLIIHPDFNPNNRAHDLALIQLSNVVTLERRIKPICLPTLGRNYLGQVATVIGWTLGQSEAICKPRKLGVPILGPNECVKSVLDPKFYGPDKGCVGIVGGYSVICKEDAGAPVVFRNYKGIYELIGILTDQNECSNVPSTALYTKINENIKWILHHTNDACYCTKP